MAFSNRIQLQHFTPRASAATRLHLPTAEQRHTCAPLLDLQQTNTLRERHGLGRRLCVEGQVGSLNVEARRTRLTRRGIIHVQRGNGEEVGEEEEDGDDDVVGEGDGIDEGA